MSGSFSLTPQSAFTYQYTNPDIPAGNTVNSALLLNPETTFTSSTAIPSSAFRANGIVRLYIAGIYGSSVASLPLTVRFKSGSVNLAAMTVTPVVNLGTQGWEMELVCNVLDLSTVEIQGTATFGNTTSSMMNVASLSVNMNNDVPISASAQWGALAIGGTIQLRILIVQVS